MTIHDSYKACLNEMFALRRFGIKLGLSTIKNILQGLNNPQDRFKSIHVAGTNGKGSIASALASILNMAGYTVGLYTSPHLVRFNERICVNNSPISDQNVVTAYMAVKRVGHGSREPTFFEYTTAMAFYEFGRRGVDWAVIETGMGGRLDATNIIAPLLTIISNISLEHKLYLGNTIARIAREKGGIIKKNTPVVTGARQKNAILIFESIAVKKNAPLYRLGKAFRVRRNQRGSFTYLGIQETWHDLQMSLHGDHQTSNAALALAACEILKDKGVNIPLGAIKAGLLENVWPGRLEIVSKAPLIILDGAHNQVAARTLAKYIREHLKNHKITLVVGILDDKPYAAMLKCLLPFCGRAIITRPKIELGIAPEKLFPIAKKVIDDVTIIPDVAAAVSHAIKSASSHDAVCIAGSLYVVGEAKEALEKAPLRRLIKGGRL